MGFDNLTRERMWARQQIPAADVDYAVWERQNLLRKQGAQNAMEAVSRSIETGVLIR